ncbi:hypothetical protein J416_13544 [Gracilibacillus halophilus YIM-C55.5]|uniref:Esterase n=1 Tax=Gracilibacillus halophilus YIM-C55.5 TaxID=1308866 RepID=N4WRT3_9BACI|nr:hypothetical protein J416_13544 [Gracilibacillus halophilus YIM-C55.5]
MEDTQINSRFLQEAITLKWYLPEGFHPFQDYQLCIMQDGDDYFRMGRIATLSDELHSELAIEPTIFVGIHYKDKYDRREKYHPEGKQNQSYIDFLVKEAIPAIEDKLYLQPIATNRVLIGDSLAGTLAFMVASQFPSSFGKILMQSPLVTDTVLERAKQAESFKSIEVYHTIGTEETAVHTTTGDTSDFLSPNRTLHQTLQGKLSSYTYHEFEGNHTWKYWQKDLRQLLISMLKS